MPGRMCWLGTVPVRRLLVVALLALAAPARPAAFARAPGSTAGADVIAADAAGGDRVGADATGDSASAGPLSAEVQLAPGAIRGRLTKAGTDQPLQFAYITLKRTDIPTDAGVHTTNDAGLFEEIVPAGTYDVRISYLLWPEKTLTGVVVRPGEAVILDLQLTDQVLATFKGHVVDGLNGTENISQATLQFIPIDGRTPDVVGAVTGPDGRFTVSLPAGIYEVRVMAMNYDAKLVPRVAVSTGYNSALRVEMFPRPKATMKEIVVTGNAIRNTKVAELQTRKNSAAVTDGISREAIKKGADSDAAQVLGRVTGITVKDGKFLVVRGLSERYASTQVNGVRVGSPEANRKVVPMDIFPATLLDNIVIQKTYTPDQWGDFGGGSVQIKTRDIPDEPVLSTSVGMGARPGTTGEDGLGYAGGGKDWLGTDDGTRSLPDLIDEMAGDQTIVQRSPLNPNGPGFSREEFLGLARSFTDQWGAEETPQSANVAYNLAGGRRFDLLGNPLGLIGAVTYSNGATTQESRIVTYESADLSGLKADYDETKTTRSVLLGGTGNLNYRIGEGSILRSSLLYTRSSDDEARRYQGYYVDVSTDLRSERLLFSERDMILGTLGGEHALPVADSRFEWKLNRSAANRAEPDRRENFYEKVTQTVYDETETGSVERDTTFWAFSRRGAVRLFSDLEDDEKGLEGHWTIPFRSWAEGDARLKLGGATQRKERAAWTRRFTFKTTSGTYTAPIDSVLTDANIGSKVNFTETTRGTDYYWAEEQVDAGYAMVDMPVMKRLRMLAGARVETGRQTISYYGAEVFKSDLVDVEHVVTDVLPSLNLTWALGSRSSLRAAASRSINRPDLRELSPSEFSEYESGASVIGNPALERARMTSYDLRWETFPTMGELFAASVFYKELDRPIESTIQGGESPRKQPVNTEGGSNLGLELEARTGLGRFWRGLDRFALNGNLTLVDSEVRFADDIGGVQTSRVRPLVDQSEFVGNLGLFFTSPRGWTEVSLYYNYFGRRLTDVGVYGQADIYEEGRESVDLAMNQRLSRSLRLKFVGRNLTDATVRKTQGGLVREEYRSGSSYAVALTLGD